MRFARYEGDGPRGGAPATAAGPHGDQRPRSDGRRAVRPRADAADPARAARRRRLDITGRPREPRQGALPAPLPGNRPVVIPGRGIDGRSRPYVDDVATAGK